MSFVLHSKGRYTAHSLVDFGGRYIYPDGHEDVEYNRICSNQIDATVKRFIVKMAMLFLSFGAGVTGPVYALLFYGINTTTIEVKFPYIEEKSDAEFIGNFLLQTMIASHGIIGYIGIEVAMGFFSDIVIILPKIAAHELNKLDISIENGHLNHAQVRLTVRNIVKQALDADEYVWSQFFAWIHIFQVTPSNDFFSLIDISYAATLRDLLYYRTLVTPPTFTYAIAMAIFCQYWVWF